MTKELSNKVIKSEHWEWMPGMTNLSGYVFLGSDEDGLSRWGYDSECKENFLIHHLPDLSSPSTLGCLLDLVRRKFFDSKKLWNGYVEIQRDHNSIFFLRQPYHNEEGGLEWKWIATGESEAEVLVNALLK